MQLPEGFVDKQPQRGPFIDPAVQMPEPFRDLQLLLADGTTEPGDWTGKVFWRDRELHPIGWRYLVGAHKAP